MFYAKVFFGGVVLGGLLEVALVKGNYYQMLAVSEAKARQKKREEELDELARYEAMKTETKPETRAAAGSQGRQG
ncbi:hypothetical protein BZG36_04763 [Bifiguratus adelaidae]|uniref:Uncharacterized protein n=1 Tax=Bifiguratus adelaidae TaxID=1938954 RepID=A0A261XVZ9_9FUNG|nr:hypothetical protein BZG36_04763 [Bifiguratus adelaidae]